MNAYYTRIKNLGPRAPQSLRSQAFQETVIAAQKELDRSSLSTIGSALESAGALILSSPEDLKEFDEAQQDSGGSVNETEDPDVADAPDGETDEKSNAKKPTSKPKPAQSLDGSAVPRVLEFGGKKPAKKLKDKPVKKKKHEKR